MTMALSLSQAFLGAITIGIGLSRGVEADLSFHVEDLTGEANYAASRVASGHARASNAITDNNVLATAAMAPRLAVESDNITMDESAAIACAQPLNAYMAAACEQYTQNKPRAVEKLTYIRTQQMALWSSLEKLSANMDKVAGAQGRTDATANLKATDPGLNIAFADPTQTKETWGNKSAMTSCNLASKDALGSPMTGHAFPILMPPVLPAMPQALVGLLPSAMCNVPQTGMPDAPTTAPAPTDCGQLEQEMQDQIAYANGVKPVFSSDVEPFVKCTKKNTCRFDYAACTKAQKATSPLASLNLKQIPDLGTGLGGSTRSPSAANPNESDDFRACATVDRTVDQGTSEINEAGRTLMSFGGQADDSPLAQSAARTSCGKWYFPTGNGSPFAAVPKDQQAFVPAWRHTLVQKRSTQ